jgi:hypothetical protein
VSNHSVTDEVILAGFRSLHEAMALGFDRVDRRFEALEKRMAEGFAAVDRRFAEFDARMIRHFDERDARLDNHAGRISALEANT